MVAVTVLAAAFAIDGRVTRGAGGVLVAVFVVYVGSVLLVLQRGWLRPPQGADDDAPSLVSLGATLVVSLAVLSAAAEAIVLGAVHIAHQAGLSEYAIGATVVAIGTTLPDKAISFIGGRCAQGGVVTANALGSNIFLLTLVLGLAALSTRAGVAVSASVAHVDLPLLALYAGYISFALVRG